MTHKKRILVTGGAGYIGSHAVRALLKSNKFKVVVIDDLSTGHQKNIPKNVEFINANLSDINKHDKEIKKIDAVMHFAAYSIVGESFNEPLKYWRNNVGGTTALLEYMKKHNIKNIIFSSTAAVYGEPNNCETISENDQTNPINPYGATKLACEMMIRNCFINNQFSAIILRYFNVAGWDLKNCGELHNPETHLIPIALEVVENIRPALTIYGTNYNTKDGTCIRDYIHISDLINAHMLSLNICLNSKSYFDTFNLGSGEGYSILDIINTIEKVTNKKMKTIKGKRRDGDPPVLVTGINKAFNYLKWRPKKSLEDIISDAWEWTKIKQLKEGSNE